MSFCSLSAFSITDEPTTDPRKAHQPAATAPNKRADNTKRLTLTHVKRNNTTELEPEKPHTVQIKFYA